MSDPKRKDDEHSKHPANSKLPHEGNITNQLHDEMKSSFDDIRSEMDNHLAGRSDSQQRGGKPRTSTDFPWSSELDADEEVTGTPRTPKRSSTCQEREGNAPLFSDGRRDNILPPNWDQMSANEQHCFLERLHFTKQVRLKDIIHLYPQASSVDPDSGLADESHTPVQEKKVLGLFSRASRTRKKHGSGYLTGKDFGIHMDSLDAHAKGDDAAFDPKTEEAFNTDARNLREYNTRLNVAKGATIQAVRDAKRDKDKLLQAYEDLGRRQEPKRNYPHANQSDYAKEILFLKEAYRKGHRGGQ
jgi:hypothetical protein